jgi:hypothetical protein
VSWIVAPEAYSEHPNWEPDFGAWYVSQVVDILAANPEVWSKMAQGLSTVPTTNEIFPGDAAHPAGPYGLGIRVPMIIVSPWTRGGWVNSQLFDRTSLIRFLEARFGHGKPDLMPDTDDFKPVDLVRQLGAGYDLSVHGPNGFFRHLSGSASGGNLTHLDIRTRYDERDSEIILEATNRGSTRIDITVSDRYSSRTVKLSLEPGGTKTQRWSLSRTRGWYDLTVTVDNGPHLEYRYAGHLENGEDSISDPGMGGLT